MSVINPNETAAAWKAHTREAAVQLYLSGADGDAAALVGARVAGFPISLNVAPLTDLIDPEDLAGSAAAVVQVDPAEPKSLMRFEKLASSTKTPLIAAAYEPPLALVRQLVRAGAHDVVPLPLDIADLETSLLPIRDQIHRNASSANSANGKMVCVIKSVGGIGATALLDAARDPRRRERGACRSRGLPHRSRRAVRRCRLPAWTAAAADLLRPGRGRADGSTENCCAQRRRSIPAASR